MSDLIVAVIVASEHALLHAFAIGAGFAIEQDIAAFAVHALWQVPLLACAAAMAVRIGRPQVRTAHAVWVATLALCVFAPLFSTALAHRAAVAAQHATATDDSGDDASIALADLPPMQREPAWKLLLRHHVLSPTPFAFTLSPRVARSIALVYALIAFGFAARLLLGWRRTRRLVRGSITEPLPPSIAQALHRQCEAIGCRAPRAALTDGLAGPALAGVLRPTLLLPAASAAEMSAEEIDAILAHELAHLRRGDPVLHAICSLLLLPVGFHPAAAWAARRVRQTREMACDAEAAERLGSAANYARALLQVAERSGGLRGAGVGLGLFGLGFFGLGLFDSDVRPRGGYRAALRGGRLQHGRGPATAGLPLFGVAGAMEERMQTMMNTNPPESGAKRTVRGVAAAGLAAAAVMAAAMVQVQPALAHAQDAAPQSTSATPAKDDSSPRLIGGEHAQQQLQNARRQLAEAEKSASTDVERNRLAAAQAVIATAQQQIAAASGHDRPNVMVNLDGLDALQLDPKVRVRLDALKDLRIDPKVFVDAEKIRADFAAQQASIDAMVAEQVKAFYDSPEWKAQLERTRAEAERARVQVNSPEMQAQIAAATKIDHAKIDAQVREALEAARKQMDANKAQRAAAMEQMREATRQQAEADRLMARVEVPPMPGTPVNAASSAAQDAGKPIRIDGKVLAANALTKTPPVYPQSAKDAHISGVVIVHVIVNEAGKVQDAQITSAPAPALAESAMQAVMQWTYRPYLLNGKPTAVESTVTVNYSFGGETQPKPDGAEIREDRPALLTHVDPVSPGGAHGRVVLRVEIGTAGKVQNIQTVSSPDTQLAAAAIDAVKQWTYQPTVRNGVPVAVNTTVNVNFGSIY